MENQSISINLSKEEALVLFDWLVRFNELEYSDSFEDQSEQRILYNLESIIEKQLSVTFQPNYKIHLAEARESLRDKL